MKDIKKEFTKDIAAWMMLLMALAFLIIVSLNEPSEETTLKDVFRISGYTAGGFMALFGAYLLNIRRISELKDRIEELENERKE